MSNQVFNINYNRLVIWLLPTFLRAETQIVWLHTLIEPVKTLYGYFLNFRAESLYKLSHNSQVIYLEKVLNDAFNPPSSNRQIYINNAELNEPVWFYEVEDNKPVWFYEIEDNKPVYFYEVEDLEGTAIDFTVYVPIELRPLIPQAYDNFINRMRALVDYYKLYSKHYEIVFYE